MTGEPKCLAPETIWPLLTLGAHLYSQPTALMTAVRHERTWDAAGRRPYVFAIV
jgi:hypothetical protein